MPIVDGIVPGMSKPVALIGIAEKGYLALKLEARGCEGHSSIPCRNTAIGKLARAIRRLESNPMPTKLEEPMSGFFDFLAPEMDFGMRLVVANRWLFAPLLIRALKATPETDALIRSTTAITIIRWRRESKVNFIAKCPKCLEPIHIRHYIVRVGGGHMAQKAPGKYHREGMTLAELFHMFPDDTTAERWFADQRWPEGPHCPYCGSTNVQSGAKHKTMPYRCREKECAKRFSVRTKTPMESSKLGFQVWAVALYQVTTNLKGVSSMKLHRDLGITQRSAWFLAHRLRESWKGHAAKYPGPVEVDETYIGGKRKNMPKAKRKALTGRGAVGKAVVIGIKDSASNRVTARKVEATDAKTLQGFVADHVAPGATVYTDEASSYKGMPFHHESVNHSVGEYVRGQAHTNGIESFWAMLKRGYQGTFLAYPVNAHDRYM